MKTRTLGAAVIFATLLVFAGGGEHANEPSPAETREQRATRLYRLEDNLVRFNTETKMIQSADDVERQRAFVDAFSSPFEKDISRVRVPDSIGKIPARRLPDPPVAP